MYPSLFGKEYEGNPQGKYKYPLFQLDNFFNNFDLRNKDNIPKFLPKNNFYI